MVDLVDYDAGEGKLRLVEPLPEKDRLIDRLAFRRRHEHEGRVLVGEQLAHALGAVSETRGHASEALEEVGEVLQ